MYLYNITYIVEDASANQWINWVKGNHIPAILSSENFVSHRVLTVVDSPNEGTTYCAQFIAETLDEIRSYQANFEAVNQLDLQNQFANKFVSFITIMEFIS